METEGGGGGEGNRTVPWPVLETVSLAPAPTAVVSSTVEGGGLVGHSSCTLSVLTLLHLSRKTPSCLREGHPPGPRSQDVGGWGGIQDVGDGGRSQDVGDGGGGSHDVEDGMGS